MKRRKFNRIKFYFNLQTPLHICSEYGFVSNIRLLLSYKASLIAKDIGGLTPYDIAENGGHSECAHLLRETAGKPNIELERWHLASTDIHAQCLWFFANNYAVERT